MKKEYIRPSKFEPLQIRECIFNARTFLKNELNIGFAQIDIISRDQKKVIFQMKNRPEVRVVVYRNISRIKFE